MNYYISRNCPTSQFIQIQLHLHCDANEKVLLQLAAWRPGRYELANYAQKIRGFKVRYENIDIDWKKNSKDQWEFIPIEKGEYKISYEFYASQMDAGGSWSDDQQLYLNFSNFAFEVLVRKKESIKIDISVPKHYKFATALPFAGHILEAENYQHLMDSPCIASEDLKHFSYSVASTMFHLWFQGEINFDVNKLIEVFRKFTIRQIEAFGEFPAEDYHFIYQLLPYSHFHGVEHQFSTVITYGPAESLNEKRNLDKFFGVSSHELYHFWNVCRIRPKELLPYDLSKEILLDTGVVLEGVTTYMGDLYLLKSGYYSLEEYLSILEKLIQKEFESQGWQNQSIVESSIDLWLDGYKIGIPDKKVSIYNRGAIISLFFDLMLLDQNSSLEKVMAEMWENFGKKGIGYTLVDFENLVFSKFHEQEAIKSFFNDTVRGRKDIFSILKNLLESIGIGINQKYTTDLLSHYFGIITDDKGRLIRIHADSRAYHSLMLGDQILSFDKDEISNLLKTEIKTLDLIVNRWGRKLNIVLKKEQIRFFPEYKLTIQSASTKRDKWIS